MWYDPTRVNNRVEAFKKFLLSQSEFPEGSLPILSNVRDSIETIKSCKTWLDLGQSLRALGYTKPDISKLLKKLNQKDSVLARYAADYLNSKMDYGPYGPQSILYRGEVEEIPSVPKIPDVKSD